MSINIKTPFEMTIDIAKRAKKQRLALNLSQQNLSKKSGISYGTLKKFEQTGKISLESLLKIALTLNAFNEFDSLFIKKPEDLPASLNEL